MNPKPPEYMRRTRQSYLKLGYQPYLWYQADSAPAFTPPSKPLSEARLGMISTAGAYVQGQVAYHYKDDTGIRTIPRQTPVSKLRFSHIMENYLVEARQDPCTVFPIEALDALHQDGSIGALADNYFSCMGGIYSQSRVRDELLPSLSEAVSRERLELLLLVPL